MASPIISVGFAKPSGIDLGTGAAPLKGAGDSSFAELMRGIAKDTISATNRSETDAIGALSKGTSIIDVVTSVTNAEVALETAVAVRDRVIAAYQQIIRMPI